MRFRNYIQFAGILSMHFWIINCYESGQYLQIEAVHRPVNEAIVKTIGGAESLLHCAFKCKRDSSESLYFKDLDQTCTCNKKTDTSTYVDPEIEAMVYGSFENELTAAREITSMSPEHLETTIPRQDCNKHSEAGHKKDGVYPLHVTEIDKIVYVWCDMGKYSLVGPLTYFQYRHFGTLDFYRPWSDYEFGFGNAKDEFWLGLENIAAITTASPYGVYILIDNDGSKDPSSTFMTFQEFSLDANANYRMMVSDEVTYGECFKDRDGFFLGKGQEFSTFDKDNDLNENASCARLLKSAWWFGRDCDGFQLNGPISNGSDIMPYLRFSYCWGTEVAFTATGMAFFVE